MGYSSLTLAGRTTLSGVFFRNERRPHPRASFNRRRRDAAGVIEHQPKLRIQVATLPGPCNFHQTTQAEGIGLFSALLAIEQGARKWRHGMYRASIFVSQESAGAIGLSSWHERTNAD
jgi:hypothetical protein